MVLRLEILPVCPVPPTQPHCNLSGSNLIFKQNGKILKNCVGVDFSPYKYKITIVVQQIVYVYCLCGNAPWNVFG